MSDQPIIDFEMPEWTSTPFDYPSELGEYLVAPDYYSAVEKPDDAADTIYDDAYMMLDLFAEHVALGGNIDTFSFRNELFATLRRVPEVADFLRRRGGNRFLETAGLMAIAKRAALILNARGTR